MRKKKIKHNNSASRRFDVQNNTQFIDDLTHVIKREELRDTLKAIEAKREGAT